MSAVREPFPRRRSVPLTLMSGQSPSCFVLRSLHRETLQISTDKLFPGLFLESRLWQAGGRAAGISPGGFSQKAVYFGGAGGRAAIPADFCHFHAGFQGISPVLGAPPPRQQCRSCSWQRPSSEIT